MGIHPECYWKTSDRSYDSTEQVWVTLWKILYNASYHFSFIIYIFSSFCLFFEQCFTSALMCPCSALHISSFHPCFLPVCLLCFLMAVLLLLGVGLSVADVEWNLHFKTCRWNKLLHVDTSFLCRAPPVFERQCVFLWTLKDELLIFRHHWLISGLLLGIFALLLAVWMRKYD